MANNPTVVANKLTISAINVNSIRANHRRHNLVKFLDNVKPDVIALSETRLNYRHIFNIENYALIRCDRESKEGGGTAIAVERSIPFTVVKLINLKTIETTVIKIKYQNKNLFIIGTYIPPKPTDKTQRTKHKIQHDLNQIFKTLKLNETNNTYVLIGDLNSRHTRLGDSSINCNGSDLTNWIESNDIEFRIRAVIASEPTFTSSNAYLDMALIDHRLYTQNKNLTTHEYESDHKAISLIINFKHEMIDKKLEHENAPILYKKTNWKKFQHTLNEKYNTCIPDNKNLTNDEIDEHITELQTRIKETIDEVSPRLKFKTSTHKYINNKLENLYKIKSNIQTNIHKLLRNKTTENQIKVTELKSNMKEVKDKIKLEFNRNVTNFWRNEIKKVDYRDSANFFPALNKIFRKKNNSLDNILINDSETHLLENNNINTENLTIVNGKKLIDNQEHLPNIIGSYFEKINSIENSINSTLENIVHKKTTEIITKLDNHKTITTFGNTNKAYNPRFKSTEISFTNIIEVKTLIKCMSNKTSTGIDQIPNVVLKKITTKCIKNYTIIFNNAINNGYFPEAWKTAKLVVLKKKQEKESTLDNLRPISLLPVISKILERIVNKQLVKHAKNNDIIPDYQFGFKEKHSTIHAISKLLSDINWHLAKGEMTGAGLIDLKKAFDSVWLDGLTYKLNRSGLSGPLLKLVNNMIRNRNFKVHLNNQVSEKTFKITRGLQQGTVNSPTLFNIYNANTLKMFNLNSGNGCYALAFADDLILYVADKNLEIIKNKLQDLYTKIKNYYMNWKLEINASKCETILFRKPLRNHSKLTNNNWNKFEIKDFGSETTAIPHRRSVKYLGVNLDDLLRFNSHTYVQLDKAKKTFKHLHKLFYSRYLETRAKVIAYQSIIRPILTYACPTWFNLGACNMEKFRRFERKCLKVCHSYYREPEENYRKRVRNKKIYVLSKIPRIDIFIIHLLRKHIKKAINTHCNSLIFGPYFPNDNYYRYTLNKGLIPPDGFLYLDLNNYIVDNNNVPLLYHVSRDCRNKKITFNPEDSRSFDLVYDRDVTLSDKKKLSNFSYYKKKIK